MEKKKVLVLCTHNSARSQLAEAIFRHLGAEKIEVKSAGLNPCGVNPYVFRVLDEVGIDSSGLYSKNVMDFLNEEFDYVITVCDRASQVCPTFPGFYKKLHFSLKDPAEVQEREEEIIKSFRETRNIIKALAIRFLGISLEKGRLKCPHCGFIQEVDIPQGRCLISYKCSNCQKLILTPQGNCCVICGFSDKVCHNFYEQTIRNYYQEYKGWIER